ncbi:aqualysin-1-like [Diadema antillarum]|uniref:aqualysin-1-like n=1 Tax=Diadema antillarum TaxID=105358 RepID=UPI003A8B5A19
MRAFLALLLVAAATAELAPLLKNSEPIPGKYIIKLKDEFDVDEIASTVRLTGGRVGHKYRHVLNGFAAELSDKVLDIVRSLAAVEYVEQDGVYRTQVTWGLDRIDQRDLPLDDTYTTTKTGSGYTVWVIDTGVHDTHINFGGRAEQVVDCTDASSQTSEGCIVGGSDENGHGTHCAGTVGSNTYGVATGVSIKGVRVLGRFGAGSTNSIMAGCDYVVENAVGNDVASMSLGGGASTSLDSAVAAMVSAGVPTAVAAGNSNEDACSTSPARESSAITVGATDNSDRRSSFSNYGSCVDIFAPGTDITSTWNSGNTATNTISGTSMACPHVAGAIALYSGNTADMLSGASDDKIADTTLRPIGSGSPNKLLYVS